MPVESAEPTMLAKKTVELDAAKARQALRLVEQLEDLDDVPARHRQLRHPRGTLRRGRRVIVLGIDPGTAALGYGIVESNRGRLREVDHGCLETSPDTALPERLLSSTRSRRADRPPLPDLLAVERLFFSRNVQTAFAVGQARGVVLLAAAQHRVPVHEATPTRSSRRWPATARADKEQVQRMVQLVLGLAELPRPDDAADALAIAIWARTAPGRAPVACRR